ncbi:MAG TPA: C39 family peptidase [Rectinemataceae bacterium]|nr:C39 family peptidase [Rectinemataceae bacterium]
MSETETRTPLASSSYGAMRIFWSFGSDLVSERIGSYSPVHDVGLKLDGLLIAPAGLQLAAGFSRGSVESDPINAPPFDWLLPWWNVDTAGKGVIEISLQVEVEGAWSRWYPMGTWSRTASSFSCADETAHVDTDTLILATKSGRYRMRMELFSGEEKAGSVIVKRVGFISRDRSAARTPTRPFLLQESASKVPPRSQMSEAEDIRGRICSPTCGAMALRYCGVDLPTSFVAADCYDEGAKIYGNWPFNVASLWRLGLRAKLDFFPSMEMAVGELFAGRVIIASIKFAEGQLSGSPIAKTNGHLVLITGLKKNDSGGFDVLVNDPAAATTSEVPRRYKLTEFENVWNGVGYVIEGRR